MTYRLSAVFVLLAVLGSAARAHDEKDHLVVSPEGVKWVDAPPSLPPGAKVAVLEGDPTKEGHFVMRAKLPDGYRIMPHTHPKDERVTVLSGTLQMGTGDRYDEKATKPMAAGSYGRMGAGVRHFAYARGETIIQVHGQGPWVVEYVNPNDDPRKKK
jgi:quercetin dioxygenase-like cupin family protein